jgi:hypothetical protein
MEESYPPGTRVKRLDPDTKMLLVGMVMDIPCSSNPSGLPIHQILFDNGTTASIPLADIALIIPPPPISDTSSPEPPLDEASSLLPTFLMVDSCITYKHDGTYHKGYLMKKSCGIYCFSFKTHVKKKHKDWGVNLPHLLFNWADLCTEGILLPGHVACSFICMTDSLSSTFSNPPSTFDPVANIVSAVNLHCDCPPSLLQALATSHPYREIWLQSYYEEKCGIESLGTYCLISLGEYCALCEKGAPKAIPTMCVSTIKKD